MISVKKIVSEAGKCVFWGGVSFGLGCLAGKIVKAPVLKTGGLYALAAVASQGLDLLVRVLAKKYDWNLSTVKFFDALSSAATAVAMAVSALALGIFSPTGAVGFFVLGLLGSAFPIGVGLYAKYGGRDCLYQDPA
ncbi:MAG: hypothetical protein ACE5GN_04740 [Waddliaceae bacterium]